MIVTGCHDCPMLRSNNCRLHDGDEYVYPAHTTPPDFCPLHRGPVTVALDEEEKMDPDSRAECHARQRSLQMQDKMSAPQRQPEVMEQIESFMREAAVLMDRVDELDTRLEPVSRQKDKGESLVKSTVSELSAPMAQALRVQIDNLSVANGRLGDILARLEV